MSTIEKLTSIKKRMLDKMITKESIKNTKECFSLKGSYFKHLFSYMFFKKLKIKDPKRLADSFFLEDGGYNFPKLVSGIFIGFTGVITFLAFLIGIKPIITSLSVSACLFLVYFFVFFIIMPYWWIEENKQVNKKFNPENIIEIKEKIMENYNEEEIKQILNGNLEKQDLVQIFKEIEEVVGEKQFLDVFENLNLHKKVKDISDPYALLLVINNIIESKKDLYFKNEKTKINQEIMNSLLNESKETEKEKIYEYVK